MTDKAVAATIDIREKGAADQILDKRLFCQLQVFTGCQDPQALVETLKASSVESVLYLDVNDPRGVGVLTMSEDPNLFVREARTLLTQPAFGALTPVPEMTMMGRTYSIGHERDLEDWMIEKPKRIMMTTLP